MSKLTTFSLILLSIAIICSLGTHIYMYGYEDGAKDMVIKINHVNGAYTDA